MNFSTFVMNSEYILTFIDSAIYIYIFLISKGKEKEQEELREVTC